MSAQVTHITITEATGPVGSFTFLLSVGSFTFLLSVAASRRGIDHTVEERQDAALQLRWCAGLVLQSRHLLHANGVPRRGW